MVLKLRLGLDLGTEKSLAYITVVMLVIIVILKDTETFQVLFIVSVSLCCAWKITTVEESTVAFTFLKANSAKCLCLLTVVLVLVLLFWSWSWS